MLALAQKTECNEINHYNTMQTLAAYEGDTNMMQQQRKRGSRGRNGANMSGKQTAKQKDVQSLPFTTKCSNIGE
jgi:hypothetical protein